MTSVNVNELPKNLSYVVVGVGIGVGRFNLFTLSCLFLKLWLGVIGLGVGVEIEDVHVLRHLLPRAQTVFHPLVKQDFLHPRNTNKRVWFEFDAMCLRK